MKFRSDLDDVISCDLRKIQANLTYVWGMWGRAEPPIKPGDWQRTVILSETVLWVADVCLIETPAAALGRPGQVEVKLAVANKYVMHAIPVADFHHVPRDSAQASWPKKNAKVIMRWEKGNDAILIVTSRSIAELFVGKEMGDLVVVTFPEMEESGHGFLQIVSPDPKTSFLLFQPNQDHVKSWEPLPLKQEGIYQEMLGTLQASQNLN